MLHAASQYIPCCYAAWLHVVRNNRLDTESVIIATRKVVPQKYGAHPIDCASNINVQVLRQSYSLTENNSFTSVYTSFEKCLDDVIQVSFLICVFCL